MKFREVNLPKVTKLFTDRTIIQDLALINLSTVEDLLIFITQIAGVRTLHSIPSLNFEHTNEQSLCSNSTHSLGAWGCANLHSFKLDILLSIRFISSCFQYILMWWILIIRNMLLHYDHREERKQIGEELALNIKNAGKIYLFLPQGAVVIGVSKECAELLSLWLWKAGMVLVSAGIRVFPLKTLAGGWRQLWTVNTGNDRNRNLCVVADSLAA